MSENTADRDRWKADAERLAADLNDMEPLVAEIVSAYPLGQRIAKDLAAHDALVAETTS